MEGYLRPGCVHVTVQAIVDQDTHDTSVSGGIANVVRQLIARAAPFVWFPCRDTKSSVTVLQWPRMSHRATTTL